MAEIRTIRPLQENRIRYASQVVAVIADTDHHAARNAGRLLRIEETPDETPVAARLHETGSRLENRSAGRHRTGTPDEGPRP